MTEAKVIAKVGPTITREFEIVNVLCWDESQVVYLDTSSNGTPAGSTRLWQRLMCVLVTIYLTLMLVMEAGEEVSEPQKPRKK